MRTKTIGSTEAQNNFGQVLDDVTHKHSRYIVKRRGIPQAVIMSFDDFNDLLNNESKRQQMGSVLKEFQSEYNIGQVVVTEEDSQ